MHKISRLGIVGLCVIAACLLPAEWGQAEQPKAQPPAPQQGVKADIFDRVEEFNKLKAQASSGDADAQFRLAMYYYHAPKKSDEGESKGSANPFADLLATPRYKEALALLQSAAEKGHAESQFWLGRFYECAGLDEWRIKEYYGLEISQDGEKALKWYRSAAEKGSPSAQFHLGFLHSVGRLVAKDAKLAETWFSKAAKQGCQAAKEELDYLRSSVDAGTNMPFTVGALKASAAKNDLFAELILFIAEEMDHRHRHKPEAFQWLQTAAERRCLPALAYLVGCYLGKVNLDVAKDESLADEWIHRAETLLPQVLAEACKGNIEAQFSVGLYYLIDPKSRRAGEKQSKHLKEAYEWLTKAALRGYAPAQYLLCCSPEDSNQRADAYSIRFHWLFRAAERGFLPSQKGLAEVFDGSLSSAPAESPTDHVEALKWLSLAAEQEDAESQFKLGGYYLNGRGCATNVVLATEWYERSAKQGNDRAQLALGELLSAGTNHSAAVQWFQKAAEQSNVVAQVRLADAYSEGKGVAQSYPDAVKWYQRAYAYYSPDKEYYAEERCSVRLKLIKACEEVGDKEAVEKLRKEDFVWDLKKAKEGLTVYQYCVGYEYYWGIGVETNYVEAAQWYRKSAESGSAEAQFRLGLMYAEGKGVPEDFSETVKWYRMAAEQGNAGAQNNLGVLHEDGRGAPQDYVEAYKWFNLAAAQGNKTAMDNRDELRKRITAEQLAEAQRRSSAFVVRKGRKTPTTDSGEDRPSKGRADEQVSKESPATPKMLGTAFAITAEGYVLTVFHVVKDATSLKLKTRQGDVLAVLVKADPVNDLALLKASTNLKPLSFAASRNAKLGDSVFTIGFPNPVLQGNEPKLTKGEISGLSGIRDDPRHFQISVAVQPGNSGGALVEQYGNVVAVVNGRLSDRAGLVTSGSLPQNVNYAVKSTYVGAFLETVPELAGKLRDPHPPKQRPFDEVVKEVQDATVMVLAF